MTPSVFIAAVTSDIGRELALMYRARGARVIGTYRTPADLASLRSHGVELIECDVSHPDSVRAAAGRLAELKMPWDLFIGAVGELAPIGRFFDCDIDEWSRSVALNSTDQLRLLHAIHPYRRREGATKVAFLVGGGINGPFPNYSAYCLGKVLLVKMCELIDDEYPDMHAIAIGTGWVNTKIHRQTIDAGEKAGDNLRRTLEFVSSGQPGTSCADILACIEWCFGRSRDMTGGRNVSVVHDSWGTDGLAEALACDADKFKLRRSGDR